MYIQDKDYLLSFYFQIPINKYNFSEMKMAVYVYLITYEFDKTVKRNQRKQSATAAAMSLQSCLTLCDPLDGRPPGSPVPGILQARTLEWVAISILNA